MSDDLDVRPIDLLDPQQEAAEEEVWDADRLRESFERTLASGRRVVESVARHRPSGRLMAFTTIGASAGSPDLGYQRRSSRSPTATARRSPTCDRT
ncbi:MAG: hypothetical protein ACKOVB_09820 [Terrabacter sp.]